MNKCNIVTDSKKLTYTAEHKPVSFAITSNVAGYEEPYADINPDVNALILSMKTYMTNIAKRSEEIMREKW